MIWPTPELLLLTARQAVGSPLLLPILGAWIYLSNRPSSADSPSLMVYVAASGWQATRVIRFARALDLPVAPAAVATLLFTLLLTVALLPLVDNPASASCAMLHATAMAMALSLSSAPQTRRSLLYTVAALAAPALAARWPVFAWVAPAATASSAQPQAAIITLAWVMIAVASAAWPAPNEVRHPR